MSLLIKIDNISEGNNLYEDIMNLLKIITSNRV